MTPEEIRAKSLQLAELYTAKGNGRGLQFLPPSLTDWRDHVEDRGPDLTSDLSRWRVKPEPRRMWTVIQGVIVCTLHDEAAANKWKADGYPVTEWQEVLP